MMQYLYRDFNKNTILSKNLLLDTRTNVRTIIKVTFCNNISNSTPENSWIKIHTESKTLI